MKYRRNLGSDYSLLYFLAPLGSGGLIITFFMYLMSMVRHEGLPMPTFEVLIDELAKGDLFTCAIIAVGVLGIIYFAFQHYRLLIWNIREYYIFKGTESFSELKKSNAEVQLMAIPLTYAMSVNVMFILGALFVPGLWGYVEYLFPIALVAFFVIGVYAVNIFMVFMSRVITYGDFDCEKNNSLSQMLSIFAFSMMAVGLSAAGAMSHNQVTSGIGIIMSVGFVSVVIVLGIIKIVLGFRAMFEHGVNKESAVTIWIVIPILTVTGIALFRITMGLSHNFGMHIHPWTYVILFTFIMAIQMFFGLLGYRVMKLIGYFREFISGESESVTTYAAICPGVAFFVMGNFLINRGFVFAGLIDKFSVVYFLLYIPLVFLQYKTILVMFRLNRKLMRDEYPAQPHLQQL